MCVRKCPVNPDEMENWLQPALPHAATNPRESGRGVRLPDSRPHLKLLHYREVGTL
jgi:hypothetical protein